MKPNKIFLVMSVVAMALCLWSPAANAQNGTVSPYSRYGYGILKDNTS